MALKYCRGSGDDDDDDAAQRVRGGKPRRGHRAAAPAANPPTPYEMHVAAYVEENKISVG